MGPCDMCGIYLSIFITIVFISFQARNSKCKEDFCKELSKLLLDVDDTLSVASSRHVDMYPELSTSSHDLVTPAMCHNTRAQLSRQQFSNTRSKSLETRSGSRCIEWTRSLDQPDDKASDDMGPVVRGASRPPQYKVLADYSAPATSARELSLKQGEVVTLIKIGCAGWWYVR